MYVLLKTTYKVHTKYIHVFFKILQKQIVFSSFLFGTYIFFLPTKWLTADFFSCSAMELFRVFFGMHHLDPAMRKQ